MTDDELLAAYCTVTGSKPSDWTDDAVIEIVAVMRAVEANDDALAKFLMAEQDWVWSCGNSNRAYGRACRSLKRAIKNGARS